MSEARYKLHFHETDTAPGDDRSGEDARSGLLVYVIGFGLAAFLTCGSFFISQTGLVWAPSIPVALAVLAIAQMGVHLVFFLHVTSGPEGLNNVMALAFGLLIVFLVITGSLWIMSHLDANMPSMTRVMQMQR